MKIEYNSIGIVHTPFKDLDKIPKQPSKAEGTKGVVEVYPKRIERHRWFFPYYSIVPFS